MEALLTIAIITVVVLGIAYIWDDLTEELRLRVEDDAAGDPSDPRAAREVPHGYPSPIMALCQVTEHSLTTPRGVMIPAAFLMGEIDLGEALDFLEYVDALG